MKENMASTTIQVQIKTAHWLKHKVIYIPREFHSFFPGDALGARGEPERATYPERGVPVIFDYGVTKSICDISTDKAGKKVKDVGEKLDKVAEKVKDVGAGDATDHASDTVKKVGETVKDTGDAVKKTGEAVGGALGGKK